MTQPRIEGVLSRFRRAARTAAVAAAAFAAAADAVAGEPVKLRVELPPDVVTLRAGEVLDVQVVPIDAAGERVVPGGRTIEASSTAGTFEVVKAPYAFRFTAPAKAAEAADVRLRAWFKEAPEIAGETTVRVLPPPPFRRIVVEGAGTAPPGSRTDLRVRGETAKGTLADLEEAQVAVKVDGPGTVTFLRTGWLRYEAPADAKGTARIVVSLRNHADVTVTHPVLVAGEDDAAEPPSPPPGAGAESQPGLGEKGGGSGGKGGEGGGGGVPPSAGEKGGDGEKRTEDPEGVAWPGGNLKVGTWRTRAEGEKEFSSETRTLPKPGGEFVTSKAGQKLRVVVLLADVAKVEVEETVGERKDAAAKRLEPSKDGRLRVEKNKKGHYVVHYEAETPEDGKPLVVAVLLTTADGKVVREELVLRREQRAKRK